MRKAELNHHARAGADHEPFVALNRLNPYRKLVINFAPLL